MRRIGTLLMLAGVALWVLGFCAWASGVWITLSPAAAKVYTLALATVTGGLLLAAGAAVSRLSRKGESENRETRPRVGV